MGVAITTDEHEQKQENPFEVLNKQPGFVYRCLNKNDRNIGRKLAKGYVLVKDTDPEKFLAGDSTPMKKGGDLDTTQRISDVVLAKIPIEKYEEGRAKNKRAIARLTAMIVRDFDKNVNDPRTGNIGFNPKKDPTGAATTYGAGTTEGGWDQKNLDDKEFETKYGINKNEAEG